MSELPRDVSDQLHEPRKSFWAIWIIIIVVIIFGWFWYVEQAKQSSMAQVPKVSAPSPSVSLESLQATVINSQIPDYAEQF
jgi:hypothetical protein